MPIPNRLGILGFFLEITQNQLLMRTVLLIFLGYSLDPMEKPQLDPMEKPQLDPMEMRQLDPM